MGILRITGLKPGANETAFVSGLRGCALPRITSVNLIIKSGCSSETAQEALRPSVRNSPELTKMLKKLRFSYHFSSRERNSCAVLIGERRR